MLGRCIAPAVIEIEFCHVCKTSWLQQIENCRLPAIKHDKIRLHRFSQDFESIIDLSRLPFINCPDNFSCLIIKAVSFDDKFVENIFFVGKAFNSEISRLINNGVVPV